MRDTFKHVNSHGGELKVRWKDGSQNYDARLLSFGYLVDIGLVPKKQYVEVTTAVHEKDHIARDILYKNGHSFGVKGIKKDPLTGKYASQPYVYTNNESSADLADKILERISSKAKIKYPSNTSLVIQCFFDTLFLEDEWEKAIENVKNRGVQHRFREIFVFDSNHHYAATLHGHVRGRKK